MTLRRTAATTLAVLALAASGCVRQVSDVPDDDRPTPDETPLLEPVSPPANEVELPDDSVDEGSAPEDDEIGTEDGES